jgi:hypothetical protein
MTQNKLSECVGEDELVQLAMDELPLEREDFVLGHIADCDECAELSRRLHRMSDFLESMPRLAALRAALAAAHERALAAALQAWIATGIMATLASAQVSRGVARRVAVRGEHSVAELQLPDGSKATVSEEGNRVIVRFPGRARNDQPPAVLVAPVNKSQSPEAALPEWNGSWAASLALPEGEYVVVVGPAA